MTLGKRISTARERKGISQSRLSELLGVTRGTITRWENDTRTPDDETKRKIADILGVSVSYLMGEEPQDARLTLVDPSTQIRIPLLDMNTTACAGAGNGLDYADFAVADTILVDREGLGTIDPHRRPFAMLVEGTSMEGALVPDGSTLVINPAEEVRQGDVALISYRGNRSVKWVIYKQDGSIELHSSSTPTITIPLDEATNPEWFRIVGKVMKIRTEHEPRRLV
jgi:transcriptional regulator with XRE-family HTH domain